MTSFKKDTHYMHLGRKSKCPPRRRRPLDRTYVGDASYMPRPYRPTQRLFRIPELAGLIESFRCRACEEVQRLIEDPKYCHHWNVQDLASYRGCALEETMVCQECAEKREMKSCAGCRWHLHEDYRTHHGRCSDWWLYHPNLTLAAGWYATPYTEELWFCDGCWPQRDRLAEQNVHADREEYEDRRREEWDAYDD